MVEEKKSAHGSFFRFYIDLEFKSSFKWIWKESDLKRAYVRYIHED